MRRSQQGFTLPELLVALLIFSLVATAAIYSLRLGVNARDQLDAADRRIAEIEIARVVIKEDLAQIVTRRVRDAFGAADGPSFRGGTGISRRNAVRGETIFLSFVRGGWTNPASEAPRSSLQYVKYLEKDGALVRRIRPFLDDARGQPRFDRILISNISEFEMAFLAGEGRGRLDWITGWPAPGAADAPPKAVSIEFTSERYGQLRQLFWIGTVDTVDGGQGRRQ